MYKKIAQSSARQRLLLALIAGGAASTALPPLYLLPLLYGAFVTLGLLAFSASHPRQSFNEGFAFGFGYFALGMYWITSAMLVEPNMHNWLAPIALPFIASVLAIAIALPMACIAQLPRPWSRFFGLLLLLSLGEWLRGHLFQFPWNNFSQSFGFGNFMLQPLAVLGRDSYSLLVLASLLLVPLAIVLPKRRLLLAGTATAIPMLFAIWGLVRLDQAPDSHYNFWSNAGVRIVQPNIRQEDKLNPELAGQNLTKLIDLSFTDLPGWIGHIIWPESALHLNIDAYPKLQQDLGSLLPAGGVLITGTLRYQGKQFRNSVIAIHDSGSRQLLHDKVKLVPFGEYAPLPILNSIAGIRGVDFTPGDGLSNQRVGLLPYFSTLICYESIFSAEVKPQGRETQWLLNLTNDGWFGQTAGPYQHMAISRWRAIEEGLPLIRAANTGISVVFDAHGRILSERALGIASTINIRIPKPLATPTFFSQHPYTIWIVLLLALTLAFVASWFREAKLKLRFEL